MNRCATCSAAFQSLPFLKSATYSRVCGSKIKPAAAITWKRIAFGPIRHRGQEMGLFDCSPDLSIALVEGSRFRLPEAQAPAEGVLQSVFIDTGENGLFSIGEYTAITALRQMEAITPQEVADLVIAELAGRSTGRDVVAAISGALAGPSYRAGALR